MNKKIIIYYCCYVLYDNVLFENANQNMRINIWNDIGFLENWNFKFYGREYIKIHNIFEWKCNYTRLLQF